MDTQIQQTFEQLKQTISVSTSPFHTAKEAMRRLNEAGFVTLDWDSTWELVPGGKYAVCPFGTTVFGFQIGTDLSDTPVWKLSSSHIDNPGFRIKYNPVVSSKNGCRLNTEVYGGPILNTFFDRPLSLAGKVVTKGDRYDRPVSHLVDLKRPAVYLPNLAIHMNREANKGYDYNIQKDMLPLYGCGEAKGKFMKQIAEAANVKEDAILASDLFLYNRMKGSIWGACEEFISSPKLDDLQCAFSSLEAFLQSEEPLPPENVQANEQSEVDGKNVINEKNVINGKSIPVHCVFDNEEVGSGTKQGAASTFLADTLIRINHAMGRDEAGYRQSIANSFMLSADNAHGVHPNHTDKACPTNRPYPGNGVVIKYSANQKYTTDAVSAAVFEEICNRANVPYQIYVNRSDILGGSTLGNISTTQVPVNTVDIGLAQLAMHSPYETGSVKDTDYMIQAMKTFFEASVRQTEDGYELNFL